MNNIYVKFKLRSILNLSKRDLNRLSRTNIYAESLVTADNSGNLVLIEERKAMDGENFEKASHY